MERMFIKADPERKTHFTRGGMTLVSLSSEIGAGLLGCCVEPRQVSVGLHEAYQTSGLGEGMFLPRVDLPAWVNPIVAEIS